MDQADLDYRSPMERSLITAVSEAWWFCNYRGNFPAWVKMCMVIEGSILDLTTWDRIYMEAREA